MNRRERRKLQKQGVQVPKDPSINIKLSDLGRGIMTPAMESAMGGDNTTAVEAEKLQRWLDRLTPEQRKTD